MREVRSRNHRKWQAAVSVLFLTGLLVVSPAPPATSVTWNVKYRDSAGTLNQWYSWQSTLTYSALRTDVLATELLAGASTGGWEAHAGASVVLHLPSPRVVLAKCRAHHYFPGPSHAKCWVGL